MKKIKTILLTSFFLFCFEPFFAITQQLPNNFFKIINTSKQKVSFSLSFDLKNWQEYSLEKKSQIIFKYNKFIVYIRIPTTPEKSVIYSLMPSTETKNYLIYWNEEKELWDLEERE